MPSGQSRYAEHISEYPTMNLICAEHALSTITWPRRNSFLVFNNSIASKLSPAFDGFVYSVNIKRIYAINSILKKEDINGSDDIERFYSNFADSHLKTQNYQLFEFRAPRHWQIAQKYNVIQEHNLIPSKYNDFLGRVPMDDIIFRKAPMTRAGFLILEQELFDLIFKYLDKSMFTALLFDSTNEESTLIF